MMKILEFMDTGEHSLIVKDENNKWHNFNNVDMKLDLDKKVLAVVDRETKESRLFDIKVALILDQKGAMKNGSVALN